jgi:hypothetical protein
MAMSPNVGDREQEKFVEDGAGNTAIRTIATSLQDSDLDEQEIRPDGAAMVYAAQFELLNSILTELRILNLHMAVITDCNFEKNDIPKGD